MGKKLLLFQQGLANQTPTVISTADATFSSSPPVRSGNVNISNLLEAPATPTSLAASASASASDLSSISSSPPLAALTSSNNNNGNGSSHHLAGTSTSSSAPDFWWQEVGSRVNRLLTLCNYGPASLAWHARFIRDYIVPALGDAPAYQTTFDGQRRLVPTFPTFMCDDHSPIEYGVAWSTPSLSPSGTATKSTNGRSSSTNGSGTSSAQPATSTPTKPTPTACVRFAIEAIDSHLDLASNAGLNYTAAQRLMADLEGAGYADFTLFRKLVARLTIDQPTRHLEDCAVRSQLFFGFDLSHQDEGGGAGGGGGGSAKPLVKVKAYVLPHLKAHHEGKDPGELLLSVLEESQDFLPHAKSSAMAMVCDYLRTVECKAGGGGGGSGGNSSCSCRPPEPYILSVDAHDGDDARLKLYVRYRTNDFEEILSHLTLGGRLRNASWTTPLRRLWQLVLGHDPLATTPSPTSCSPSTSASASASAATAAAHTAEAADATMDHLTGGCMLYYDLKPGEELPHAKIYVPVRHWAEDDGEVAKGVQRFLDEVRGQQGESNGHSQGCATGSSNGTNGGGHGYSPSALGNINIVNSTSYPEILSQAFPEDDGPSPAQQQQQGAYHHHASFEYHPRPKGLRQNWICLGSKADGSFTVTTYLSPLLFARQ